MLAPRTQFVTVAGNRRWPSRRGVLGACLAAAWATCTVIGCSSPQARYKVLSVFFDGVPDPSAPAGTPAHRNGPTGVVKKSTASIHKPFAANDCNACHVGGAQQALGVGTESVIDSNVCMKCHQPIPTQFAVMHAPVAAKACLFCHSPHEASLPHLLIAPAPQLCTQCHDRSLLGKKPIEHTDEKADCLECHAGHGGDHKFFIRPGQVPATQPTARSGRGKEGQARREQTQARIERGAEATPVARASRPCDTTPEPGDGLAGENLQTLLPADSNRSTHGRDARATGVASVPSCLPVSDTRPLMLAEDVAAESGGPIVVGERPQTQFFHIEPPQPQLELRYFFENDKTRQNNGTSNQFTDNRLEEDVSFKTTGYVIHPNLVDVQLSGLLGPRQEWFDTNGQAGYGRELVYDYNVSATALRKEDAPLTLYSRRDTSLVTRQFGPSFDNTITTSGGILDWHSKTFPTRVEISHSDQDQESLDGSQVFTLSQNTADVHSEAHPSENQRLSLSYTFSQIDESNNNGGHTGTQNSSFITHNAQASHSIDFGRNRQHNLTSSVSFFDQTGDFPLERLRWYERLLLRHSPSFETRYQYFLDYQSSNLPTFGSIDSLQNAALASFTHRLYRSLVTSGTVGFTQVDRTGDTGSTDYSANLNTEYRKIVPLGRLDVTAAYAFDQQNNRAQGTITHIANQLRTFTDPMPIILTGSNVIADSIVVRDSAGIIVYTQGIDYLVHVFADRVELERVVGGRILNGQTVLISYDLAPQPANTVTDNTIAGSIRYDFEQGPLRGLGIYARYTNLDQNISASRAALFVPNSVEDTTVGAEYRFWEATLGAEQEWHNSEIAPYDATRLFARLQHRFALNSTLALNATYTMFDYTQEHNRVNLLNISGTAGYAFTNTLYGSLSLTYLNQYDQNFGLTQGVEGAAELRWSYRQTTVYAQFRQSLLDTRVQNSSYQSAYVGIRREF